MKFIFSQANNQTQTLYFIHMLFFFCNSIYSILYIHGINVTDKMFRVFLTVALIASVRESDLNELVSSKCVSHYKCAKKNVP